MAEAPAPAPSEGEEKGGTVCPGWYIYILRPYYPRLNYVFVANAFAQGRWQRHRCARVRIDVVALGVCYGRLGRCDGVVEEWQGCLGTRRRGSDATALGGD